MKTYNGYPVILERKYKRAMRDCRIVLLQRNTGFIVAAIFGTDGVDDDCWTDGDYFDFFAYDDPAETLLAAVKRYQGRKP